MSDDEGETCPYCGSTDDCSHYVTSIDRTCADSSSMHHGRMEPADPLGSNGTRWVSEALGDLYLAFMKRDPRASAEALAHALDLSPELKTIVREEFDGAFSEESSRGESVYVGEYDGWGAWVAYVEGLIEAEGRGVRHQNDVKGPPMLASSYGTWWAEDGDDVAERVNMRLSDDADRIRAEQERLESEGLS